MGVFLACEKWRGEKSLWKPYLDYLPKRNFTLYQEGFDKIEGSEKSLIEECFLETDDIVRKAKKNRKDCDFKHGLLREFLEANKEALPLEDPSAPVPFEDVLWGYYNCTSRSFGTHHLPSPIAMSPFLDLMNHLPNYNKNKYFLHPFKVHRQMIHRSVVAQEIEEQEKGMEEEGKWRNCPLDIVKLHQLDSD